MGGLRILYLARTLNGCGVEPHIRTLGKGLVARGWTVAVASDGGTAERKQDVKAFLDAGIAHYVVRFPAPGGIGQMMRRAALSLWDLDRVVRHLQPDLIHVHYRVTSPHATLARRLHRIPYVATLHLTSVPNRHIYRWLSFWGDRTIAVSHETEVHLASAFGVKREAIHLICNGVDETHFRPPSQEEREAAKRALRVANGHPVVAMLAHFAPVKRHELLLGALAELRRAGLTVCAVLAGGSLSGDSAWLNRMRALTNELGLSQQVTFPGFVDSRTVLWAADFCVLPSEHEGFPMAIVEAMHCGVVPLRTPAGGSSEQIEDGVSGFVIPFGDSNALADRIELLVRDETLRAAMSANARERALARFSATTMVEKTLAVYREVLEKRTASDTALP